MIVTRLDGGLGNQMFQYAYGFYLARRYDVPLRLDLGSYTAKPQHGYLLDRFRISAEPLRPPELERVPARYRPMSREKESGWEKESGTFWLEPALRVLRTKGSWPLFPKRLRRHKEKPFGFHPRHLDPGDNRYLVGYWQSEKFFSGCRPALLDEFQLRHRPSDATRRLGDELRQGNSLALHLRRGDYVNHPETRRLYAQLDLDHYRGCIDHWCRSHRDPHVYIFSNDPGWCRQRFDLPQPTQVIDHNTADTAHEDLWLIGQAKACIIANSTFSWWAAWLNRRPDATVYAPSRWFQPGTLDDSHIVPSDWTRADTMQTTSAAA
jgi:hypothetical protein